MKSARFQVPADRGPSREDQQDVRREEERENQKSFRALRNRHQAIESDINCLEHHGLNRCLDKGLDGFERYVGFGVLSYNLHKIGGRLLLRKREASAQEEVVLAAA